MLDGVMGAVVLALCFGFSAGCSLDSKGSGPARGRDGAVVGPCDEAGKLSCEGTALLECDGKDWQPKSDCVLGCGGTPAHCLVFTPSYVDQGDGAFQGTQDFQLPAPDAGVERYFINADTGEVRTETGTVVVGEGEHGSLNIAFSVEPQGAAAPGLAVLSLGSLTIPANVELIVRGTSAIALLATGEIVVDGVIDVGARADQNSVAGPGGYGGGDSGTTTNTGSGTAGKYTALGDIYALRGGGGGGGNGDAGGDGAAHIFDVAEAEGGVGGAALPLGDSLIGGGGGGAGRFNTAPNGSYVSGGGGGGAILLVSRTSITVTGTIRAPGHGGSSSNSTGPGNPVGSGGGGGAGGTIIFEAPTVTVNGVLAANGGGGGSSNDMGASNGGIGSRGRDDTTPAAGGTGAGACVAGGSGGALAPLNGEVGVAGATTSGGGGGGGGAAGRIVVRSEIFEAGEGAVISPAATRESLPSK